jgi:outer membrane receptor for ferrienterochelin and colicin
LAIADSIDLDVTLRPATYQLATVIVREDSNVTRLSDPTGFERRRKNGMGHYISADEIAQRQFSQTSQLLRSLPGISVNDRGVVTIERGPNTFIGTSCESVVVLVDGIAIPAEKKAWNKETGFNVNEIPIAFIRGIEVYSGPATIPAELRSSRSVCGTVAIWTR